MSASAIDAVTSHPSSHRVDRLHGRLQELLEQPRTGPPNVRARDPHFFEQLSQAAGARNSCGSAAPTRACRRTRSSAWRRARSSCTATSPTSWCTPTSTASALIQFAVDVLKVEHILVVGHYGCGGVHAALDGPRVGLVDNWMRHVGDVAQKHATDAGSASPTGAAPATPVRAQRDRAGRQRLPDHGREDAWERGQTLSVHGWVLQPARRPRPRTRHGRRVRRQTLHRPMPTRWRPASDRWEPA